MAIKSFGTRLYIDGDLIGSLTDISPGDREAEVIDVTTHESSDNSREFIGGLVDGGEATFSGFYNFGDDGQDALRDSAGADVSCYVLFSDNSGYTFSAVVKKGTGEENGLDGAVTFSGSVKVSGKMEGIHDVLEITTGDPNGTGGSIKDTMEVSGFEGSYATNNGTYSQYSSTEYRFGLKKIKLVGELWSFISTLTTFRATAAADYPDEVTAWEAVYTYTGDVEDISVIATGGDAIPATHTGQRLYVADTGTWYIWDGDEWVEE